MAHSEIARKFRTGTGGLSHGRVSSIRERQEKPLTAEFAEKSRGERREKQTLEICSAISAVFLSDLSG
jgi:hypothetical protein